MIVNLRRQEDRQCPARQSDCQSLLLYLMIDDLSLILSHSPQISCKLSTAQSVAPHHHLLTVIVCLTRSVVGREGGREPCQTIRP